MDGSLADDEPVWVPMVSAPRAFSTSPKRKISVGSYSRLPSRDGEARARKKLEYENESFDEEDEEGTQCGVGSWRPTWLQRFANLGSFTFVLSVINLLNGIFSTYFNAVITSLENRFGLSSSMMGFLKNVDNIGYICSIMIISHFCRYANKPKLFTFACITSAAATLLFAFPHFLYGSGTDLNLQKIAINITSSVKSRKSATTSLTYFCDNADQVSELEKARCNQVGVSNTLGTFNAGALAFFVISQLIQGVSNSPSFTLSVTYMDDNAKQKSSMYMGILFAMRALSPLLGYLIGAWTMSMYVDLSETDLTPRDPNWVGAWWLGFVLLAAVMLLWAIPTVLFPGRLPGQPSQEKEQGFKDMAKDLPVAVLRLLKNPVYVCLACGLSFDIFTMGFYTFLPKYIQTYYGFTPALASIVAGGIGVFGWAIGPIVCGKILSVVKISVQRTMSLLVLITLLSNVGFLIQMMISCPEPQYSGTSVDTCDSECSCNPQILQPICSDGVTYFNPCVAGCPLTGYTPPSNTSLGMLRNCNCAGNTTDSFFTQGKCPRECGTIIPYIIVAFLTTLITSTFVIPSLNLGMRCVESKDKALSLAITSSVISVFVFPAPLAFGAAIDSACVLFDSKCGVQGRCKLYDHTKFRLRLHGGVNVVKVLATCFYAAGWYFSRRYSDFYANIERKNNRNRDGCNGNETNEKKEELLSSGDFQ